MPRRNPEMNEGERKREYRMMNKRGMGEGDEPMTGAAGDIEREREKWAEGRERLSRQDL